ncbi:MipA/OmpV family protein [Pseudomonas vanderleydeniana]|uniref:MipA/OmpV family protein n=1 Tax=Pseudomonas vanderleydeniana TaxID=2745495 RepID=A0A9E6PRW9_9PSED|nr:MipA/OmpV family protein [Pseudomonas vanderleydeniana]QXI30901.1 MipA/OmpV family protein [Pseudomonas vanderleydeniana]
MRVINGLHKGLITSLAFNAALVAVQAQADEQATSDAGIWGNSTDVTIGLGASYGPRYLGSKNYTSALQPLLRVERGIFFLDSEGGLGVQYASNTGFSASASVGYDYGRADGDSDFRYGSDKLKGMDEVSGATVLNLAASQKLTSWLALNAQADLRMAGAKRGDRYRLGLESTLLDASADKITWGLNAHAGSGRFNQTYFGVTAEQSAASRFGRFKADQGIYAYSSVLSWMHTFDRHWATVASIELTHYTDQVRNSPLVTQDTTATSYIGVNYTF